MLFYQFYIEPVDGGTEQTLRLRLSTTLGEVKLPVYSKDTIGNAKKKLQVCVTLITFSYVTAWKKLIIFVCLSYL